MKDGLVWILMGFCVIRWGAGKDQVWGPLICPKRCDRCHNNPQLLMGKINCGFMMPPNDPKQFIVLTILWWFFHDSFCTNWPFQRMFQGLSGHLRQYSGFYRHHWDSWWNSFRNFENSVFFIDENDPAIMHNIVTSTPRKSPRRFSLSIRMIKCFKYECNWKTHSSGWIIISSCHKNVD